MPDKLKPAEFDHPYLQGAYAPIREEFTTHDLCITGEVPRDLNGLFAHVGPNPRFHPNVGHSWFDGDGMVQSVQLEGGRAVYRSRWVRTEGLEADIAAGRATFVGSLAKPGSGPRHKNVANTDLVFHAGKLLALWWEGNTPYELALPDLFTRGRFDYGGTLPGGLTSHAKLDSKTGELFFFNWGRKAPYLNIGVAGPDGRISRYTPIELPGPRVQHNMAISERFVAVFDFPLMIDPERSASHNLGFRFQNDMPARIGLVDRRDATAPVRWFEICSAFMWHLSSGWDEGDEFVLIGARIEQPTRIDCTGRVFDHGPIVDGEHRFDARPYQWRLNLKTGGVTETALDDLWVEFPRINDDFMGYPSRYSYMLELFSDAPTVKACAFLRYDLARGTRERLALPPGHSANEMSFAPRDGSASEDDGYLLSFVTNEAALTSELWVLPARALQDGPIARVQLPQRVVPKFHGRWIPMAQLG